MDFLPSILTKILTQKRCFCCFFKNKFLVHCAKGEFEYMYILTQIQSICLFCTQWMMPCMIILWSVKPSQLCQPSGFPKAYHHDLIKLYSSFLSHFFWQQQLFASNYYLVLVRMRNKNKKLSIIIHKKLLLKRTFKKQFWNLKWNLKNISSKNPLL